jgi:CRP-like cAMP-binding protein
MSPTSIDHHLTNRMLKALLSTGLEAIRDHLEPVDLPRRSVLLRVGTPVDHLYFVNRGLVSCVKTMEDGRAVKVGEVGTEGVIGLFTLHGVARAIWEYAVQVPGSAFRIERSIFDSKVAACESAIALLRRYTSVAIDNLSQIAACNRLHSLRRRCCRCLLVGCDSVQTNNFPLTHESLALMLGVQRSGVSTVANSLQEASLIHYRHGRVVILDRRRLEKEACECYTTVRRRLDELFASVGLP